MSNLTPVDIVEATVAQLLNRTAAGTRVYPWKTTPVQPDQLPCLVVVASRTAGSERNHGGPIYEETTQVTVECHLQGSSDAAWSVAADTMADRVKRALICGADWRGMFRKLPSVDVTIGQSVEAESRRIVATVEFSCVHDVTYEPLEDVEEQDVNLMHYTDETLLPQEFEVNLSPQGLAG